ncbi:hypothetical protein DSECCO2_401880 [anaerobic digester metagenome]
MIIGQWLIIPGSISGKGVADGYVFIGTNVFPGIIGGSCFNCHLAGISSRDIAGRDRGIKNFPGVIGRRKDIGGAVVSFGHRGGSGYRQGSCSDAGATDGFGCGDLIVFLGTGTGNRIANRDGSVAADVLIIIGGRGRDNNSGLGCDTGCHADHVIAGCYSISGKVKHGGGAIIGFAFIDIQAGARDCQGSFGNGSGTWVFGRGAIIAGVVSRQGVAADYRFIGSHLNRIGFTAIVLIGGRPGDCKIIRGKLAKGFSNFGVKRCCPVKFLCDGCYRDVKGFLSNFAFYRRGRRWIVFAGIGSR